MFSSLEHGTESAPVYLPNQIAASMHVVNCCP